MSEPITEAYLDQVAHGLRVRIEGAHSIYGWSLHVLPKGRVKHDRSAHVYTNATHRAFWGLNLLGEGHYGGLFLGAHWRSLDSCLDSAAKWVRRGVVKERDGDE